MFYALNKGAVLCRVLADASDKPLDYVILEINPACQKLMGMKRDQVIGRKVSETMLRVDMDHSLLLEEYGWVALSGNAADFELCSQRLDKYYDMSVFSPQKGYIIMVFFDVTGRKKAEKDLLSAKEQSEQERRRLETIFETSPSAIVLFNTNQKIIGGNKRARDLYGVSNHAFYFKTDLHRLVPKALDGSPVPIEELPAYRALRGEVVRNKRLMLEKVDGTLFPILASAAPIFDAEEQIASAVVIFDDISDRVDLENELENRQRLAAIGATAGMVGHDIRNPLQAMIGDVYLLKDFLVSMPVMPMKNEVAESLDSIEKNISYINKIVADLQDYARPIKPEYVEINLYELVTAVFQPINLPDNVKCSIDIDSDLLLKSDPTLVRRILTNLIINALQAMPTGGLLCISGCPHGKRALLIVEDTGVGIPEEVKPKLFTPMLTTKSKGQGLGLAVVKRLTEALGGIIEFESEAGKGTRFVVELPLNQEC